MRQQLDNVSNFIFGHVEKKTPKRIGNWVVIKNNNKEVMEIALDLCDVYRSLVRAFEENRQSRTWRFQQANIETRSWIVNFVVSNFC